MSIPAGVSAVIPPTTRKTRRRFTAPGRSGRGAAANGPSERAHDRVDLRRRTVDLREAGARSLARAPGTVGLPTLGSLPVLVDEVAGRRLGIAVELHLDRAFEGARVDEQRLEEPPILLLVSLLGRQLDDHLVAHYPPSSVGAEV